MTLGSGSGLGLRLLIIKAMVRFGFNERKRLIGLWVFGLCSGSAPSNNYDCNCHVFYDVIKSQEIFYGFL